MKRFVLALSSLSFVACGSTPALKVQSPTQGSLVDRLIAVQESFGVLVGTSNTSDEAAEKIGAYCAENAAALAKTFAEQEAAIEDEALRDEFLKRSAAVEARTNKAYPDKDHLFEDGKILEAMDACKRVD